MVELVLVPLRDRKPLTVERRHETLKYELLPYLKLGFHNNGCSGDKESQFAENPRTTFGRVELLLTLWKACGCSATNRTKGATTNKCSACLDVTQWVKQYMSKELFQAEYNRGVTQLWIKQDASYPRSLIFIGVHDGDCQPIEPFLVTTREVDGVTWLGPLELNRFTFLKFCPPPKKGANLEFGIRTWKNLIATNDDIENQQIQSSDSTSEKKCIFSQQTEEIREFVQKEFKSTRVELQDLDVDNAKRDNGVEGALSQRDHLNTQNFDKSSRGWKKSCEFDEVVLQEEGSQVKRVSIIERQLVSSSSSEPSIKVETNIIKAPDEERNDTQEAPSTSATRQHSVTDFMIYFVREGMDMIDELIEGPTGDGLKNHIMQRNAVVLDHFDKTKPPFPTHFVVSDNGIKPEKIASALGFEQVEDLEDFVDDHNIVCVHRKWAAKGNAFAKPPLRAPELLERYMGLRPKGKRKSPVKEKDRMVKSRNDYESVGYRNKKLSDHFCQLSKLYQTSPIQDTDEWRAYSFNLTAGRLRFLDFDVTDDPEVLQKLAKSKGFGATSMAIVRDFFRTGASSRLKELENDETRVVMRRMMNIWGVGRAKATELVRAGYCSIQDVKAAVEAGKLLVDRNQYIGLLCYDDILEEMNRAEVEAIFAIVETCFKEKYSEVELQLMGSYRRGKDSCGDVDILAIHPNYQHKVPPNAVGSVVDALLERGNIEHHLTYIPGMNPELFNRTIPAHVRPHLIEHRGSSHGMLRAEDTSSTTYFGVIKSPLVPGRRRRLDIKFYPYRERVFASIYFTGNGYFNRAMRLWSSRKMGLTLNDHGLFIQNTEISVLDDPFNEKEVFDKLGLVWKEVTERDCFGPFKGRMGMKTPYN
ncbi:DNA polymerase beta [Fistulifera solaris]|uniref:DNA polymerase beta n=1 Tax=Fistulifera solaris TaxID=1519565 RepID=A0A1Z5KM66_FISSO|nr:DNA polymerase beta [Fistulifera solaris]|eukprot:GAX27162.1 DNA polymerase beta [Fistulifera solaris]